jgi:hypothetical protein
MATDVPGTEVSHIWVKSSRCGPGKNCVELRRDGAAVLVRDSKSRAVLPALDGDQWIALLAHCRAG